MGHRVRHHLRRHKLCANETEKSETVAARKRPWRNQREQFTDFASDKATDEKSENTCRRRECRRLEREGQRWEVVNRWRGGDKEKAKTFGTVSPGTSQSNCESWRGTDPREFVLPLGDRSKVQKASRAVPRFCGRGKTGARRGRRGRRGNRAVPEPGQQPRTTCERWRGPTGGASVLPTPVGKFGRTKTRSVVESWRKRAPTRSRRPLPRMIWSGVCWEMVRNKKPLMAIHVLMMVVMYCRPEELLQSMREDLIRPMHGVASDWSLLLHPVLTRRAEKNTKLRRHDRLETPDLLLDHQSGCSRKRSSSTHTKISPRSFGEQHEYWDRKTLFRISAAILERRWTKRDNTAQCWRSKKRGRWKSDNSIARYEKYGRLAQIQSDLNKSQLTYFEATDLSSRGFYLWETPSRRRFATSSDGGRLFLSLVSNDRVSRAPQRLGVRASFWNLRYGERYDVTHPVNLRRLLRDIANGEVLSGMRTIAPGRLVQSLSLGEFKNPEFLCQNPAHARTQQHRASQWCVQRRSCMQFASPSLPVAASHSTPMTVNIAFSWRDPSQQF